MLDISLLGRGIGEAAKKRRQDAIGCFLMQCTRPPREPREVREPVAKRRRRSSSSEKENEPRAVSIWAMLKDKQLALAELEDSEAQAMWRRKDGEVEPLKLWRLALVKASLENDTELPERCLALAKQQAQSPHQAQKALVGLASVVEAAAMAESKQLKELVTTFLGAVVRDILPHAFNDDQARKTRRANSAPGVARLCAQQVPEAREGHSRVFSQSSKRQGQVDLRCFSLRMAQEKHLE